MLLETVRNARSVKVNILSLHFFIYGAVSGKTSNLESRNWIDAGSSPVSVNLPIVDGNGFMVVRHNKGIKT